MMKKEKFNKGETIFSEGEMGNKLYLIKKGKVKAFKNKKFIRELCEGNCFGEVALLINELRTAIVIPNFIQERNILLTLEHPFIMKLVKTFKDDNFIYFLCEYIQGRTFSKYLNTRTSKQLRNTEETRFYIATLFLIFASMIFGSMVLLKILRKYDTTFIK